MGRIVKGYWKCKYCNTKDIDGLVDECPNCGKRKSEDVKYYMRDSIVEVTDEELKKAEISREECDGNHKDWVCNYCNQLNNWGDEACRACGASKTDATHEYGMTELSSEKQDEETSSEKIDKYRQEVQKIVSDMKKGLRYDGENLDNSVEDYSVRTKEDVYALYSSMTEASSTGSSRETKSKFSRWLGKLAFGLISIGLLLFLFFPIKETVTITGFSWDRTITVEEERTVQESGWSVPSGGRVYEEREELKEYITVLDHYDTVTELKSREVLDYYETVTETKSRQVISHYDTTYTYQDNGNGTFTEVSHQTPVYTTEYYTETYQEPVYRTEYYTEIRQEPVYRQDPVYATKYYYEIERWFDTEDYESSGFDQAPHWNDSYVLKSNERDEKRSENYFVHYTDESTEKLPFEEWVSLEVGDGFVLTKNRLGIVYSKEKMD